MFDIYCSVYNFHRHKFQGVASEAGPRTSTSGGQRCLRLQPTQSIQVKSTHNRSILTDKKGQIHQALLGRSRRYCAVYTTVYFSSIRLCRSLRCYWFRFHPHVMVLPGDEIKVECNFDTTDREEFTYFGKSTAHLEQEICARTRQSRVCVPIRCIGLM